MKNKNQQKGFTILVAVVTASILLIIAMSIGGIALKEQILSNASKESQIAFYAADSGMECALYQDQKIGSFGPDTDQTTGGVVNPTGPVTFNCNGQSVQATLNTISNGSPNYNYTYTFEVPKLPIDGGTTCAIVTIEKDTNDANLCNDSSLTQAQINACIVKTHTIVKSYGYNTCNASLSRLERGIVGSY